MTDRPDLLLVAATHDRFAQRFRKFVTNAGKRVHLIDGLSAARLFTIRVEQETTLVTPVLPMLIRSSAWWHEDCNHDEDEDFLRAEAYAAFWAAASLSPAPVINRPGRHGTTSYLTTGEIASICGGKYSSSVTEFHVSDPTLIGCPQGMWGEDANYLSAPLATFGQTSCVRARRISDTAVYEVITVVAGDFFAATTDPRTTQFGLGERSLAVVKELGLGFATVTWSVEENDVVAVRVNASPEDHEVQYAWSDISIALYRTLL